MLSTPVHSANGHLPVQVTWIITWSRDTAEREIMNVQCVEGLLFTLQNWNITCWHILLKSHIGALYATKDFHCLRYYEDTWRLMEFQLLFLSRISTLVLLTRLLIQEKVNIEVVLPGCCQQNVVAKFDLRLLEAGTPSILQLANRGSWLTLDAPIQETVEVS